MSETIDIFSQKKITIGLDSVGDTETVFHTLEDVFQVWLCDPVKHLPADFLTGKEATTLHEPQMFGGHGTGQSTRGGELAHREVLLKQHLYHSQTMRVRQRA